MKHVSEIVWGVLAELYGDGKRREPRRDATPDQWRGDGFFEPVWEGE